MIDERELRARYPEIVWDEPVPVKVTGMRGEVWACRFCVALDGLAARDIVAGTAAVYHSRDDAAVHIKEAHP